MELDFESATDLVLAPLAEALRGPAEELLGYEPQVEWPDDGETSEQQRPKDRAWLRVGVRNIDAEQRSFGETGARRFGRTGLVSVQLFCPKGPRGFTILQRLGKVVTNALEGRRLEGVTVRQTVFREGGSGEKTWQQGNVTATFDYDVVK